MEEQDPFPKFPQEGDAEAKKSIESSFTVAGGEYQDPPPKLVEWINNRFNNPLENIQATVMKAFEISGVIKKEKDIRAMTKPLENTGLLPIDTKYGELPTYNDQVEINEFINRREEVLLLEFQEGHDSRNYVLQKVRDMTSQRVLLDIERVKKLRSDARSIIREYQGAPPTARIIAVMVGLDRPKSDENEIYSKPPELTEEMALDVYWMMLREEAEAKKNPQNSEAVA